MNRASLCTGHLPAEAFLFASLIGHPDSGLSHENFLHFTRCSLNLPHMTEPLAFLLYENLLPGSRLSNRLLDLGYRVTTVSEPERFLEQVIAEHPILAIIELNQTRVDTCDLLARLRAEPATRHLPVIGYTAGVDKPLQQAAHAAGASLVVVADGLMAQLPMLLEQVLEID